MPRNDVDNLSLLVDLKSILNTAELKTYEKMIMVVIKVFQAEFGTAFPDYNTIAASGGMCKRKAQYVVQDLAKRNLIEINQRFKEMPDGKQKQTSNQYVSINDTRKDHDLNEIRASNALTYDLPYAQHAPYKEGLGLQDSFSTIPSTLKSLKIDDESSARASVPEQYACYAEVYEKMIRHQGTGVLCFHQEEFLNCCLQFRLPEPLVTAIYKHADKAIQQYHVDSIYRALKKFYDGLSKQQILNPVAWFLTTFKNENLMVRTEYQIERMQVV